MDFSINFTFGSKKIIFWFQQNFCFSGKRSNHQDHILIYNFHEIVFKDFLLNKILLTPLKSTKNLYQIKIPLHGTDYYSCNQSGKNVGF